MSDRELLYQEAHEGWSTDLEKPCQRCGCDRGEITKEVTGHHYAKLTCWQCGLFIKWLPKPENEKRNRRKVKRLMPEIEYCQLCLRTRDELDGTATIEEHHVLEVNEYPELDNERENRWVVCTRCHGLIHNLRLMVRGSGGKKSGNVA